ncbi:MAG: hydrogenase small subunit [Planctomycetota bacterium]
MVLSRRAFLKLCTGSAAALGLTPFHLDQLAHALNAPTGPTVLWLQGAGCTGCSISFLDFISGTTPGDAGEVLIDVINLAYHPNLMASAGQTATNAAKKAYKQGGYVLVVEGGVPTAFDGNACWAWTDYNKDVTFESVVRQYAADAAAIVCMGQCSSYGGIFAAPPNPTQVKSVKELTGLTTINVAGCPPHPAWLVSVIAKLVAGIPISLDAYGRPSDIYGSRIHDTCQLRNAPEAHEYGDDGGCMEELGCRGKQSQSRGNCPTQQFNNGVNFCTIAGAPCFGCTNPAFPGTNPFFEYGD